MQMKILTLEWGITEERCNFTMIEVQEPSQCICIRGSFCQRNYTLRNSRNVTSVEHRSRPER